MNVRCTWTAALKPVFCTVLAVALSICGARAADISGSATVSGGGVVSFTNVSSTNWVFNSDTSTYDLVLVYTNSTAAGAAFTLPGTTKAQMLVVGGGGGGGGSFKSANKGRPNGGGGGGGAGGLVYSNALFGAGSYSVTVGRGGGGGVIGDTHPYTTPQTVDYSGEDGRASTILFGGETFITAAGGGAGGGETDGHKGGSGGGGSIYRPSMMSTSGTVHPGGSASGFGLGHAGGSGNANNYGAGGGGAGGAGAPANGAEKGVGGEGIEYAITGSPIIYAAGGGGGCNISDTTASPDGGVPGGSGDEWGRGGVGNGKFDPTPGRAGTGGGGGGASYSKPGANGGDGAVIVRIQASLAGGLDRPTDVVFEYDGETHTSYATTAFYTVEGENSGTDVGTYVARITPAAGIKWTDGTEETVTVVMTIKDKDTIDGNLEITGAPVSFFGAAETNWVAVTNKDGVIVSHDLLLKFTGAGGFTLPGTTKAQMLVVGGGGGGGGSFKSANKGRPNGGGGGGGAGGLVYSNALFGAGSYSVTVGRGGAGGGLGTTHPYANPQTVDYSGEDGLDSILRLGGETFIKAGGGGGGGGETDGHKGGSGGGGSIYRPSLTATVGTIHPGGSTSGFGLGHAGGSGNANNYGGGGGGAGGAGAPADGPNRGVGGEGLAYDIVGSNVVYAAGGGGGCNISDTTASPEGGVAGGSDDEWGRGGVGQKFDPTPGKAGTGGGGGGASYNMPGANGGDGIVYVRISMAMTGSLERPPETITLTYDGNAHTSIVSCAFYHLSPDSVNIGTNAGSYTATAVLEPGCTWLDGSGGDATVTMVIEPVSVALNSLSQEGWTYHDSPTPNPVCVYAPADLPDSFFVYEYADSEDSGEWRVDKPVDAGTYWVRVRMRDSVNFRATPETLKASFEISKLEVSFSNLRIRDWIYGTPTESTPNPNCIVSPDWVEKVYEYADSKDSETWSPAKPTAAGTHWVRVRAPDAKNYLYTSAFASFKIAKGLGDKFTDYVEISVGEWSGSAPSVLTNFPYRLTLSEKSSIGPYPASSLVGFLYDRAGLTGDDLAFTDDDGNVLSYYMKSWVPDGDSTVYVKIPAISNATQTIRMYWHLRSGQAAPEHNPEEIWSDWSEEDAAAVAQPSLAFGLVYRDGIWINYFTQLPAMNWTEWDSGETPGSVVVPAVLAEGDVVSTVINAGMEPLPAIPAADPGVYRIVFRPYDPGGEYDPIAYNIDFSIRGSLPMDDLTGGISGEMALTLNGRVMLANDDTLAGHVVKGQAYWREREVDIGGGKLLTNDVFWTHGGDAGPYDTEVVLFDGTSHRLNFIAADGSTNVLWRFDNVLLGNGFMHSGSADLKSGRCAMPYSQTSLGSSYETRDIAGEKRQSCNMIFPNKVTDSYQPAVYSPCYTNGIGTIYFDALNNYKTTSPAEADNYRIVVEVATKTDDGRAPTDENSVGDESDDLVNLKNSWVPKAMIPLKRDGTESFVAQPVTNDLALSVATERTSENFVRVCVPVNVRGPVRFRIRRVSMYEGKGEYGADSGGLILLDNIIVSYPGCGASLAPYGKYDGTRGGKQVLGQEMAMANVAFPSVGDAGRMIARGTLSTYAGISTNSTASFVQSAQLHYRWRYISQDFDPPAGEWKSVQLSPFEDYSASEPLSVRAEPGDVDFWYELKTMMPYYSYTDYTGLGAGLGGLYTEEVKVVTNRMDMKAGGYVRLPSGGSDWFVRLRAGASDWEDVSVVLNGAYKANQRMELVSDHTWRGLVKVPSNTVSGAVSFCFHGVNKQTPGAKEFAENETFWYPKTDADKLPFRGEASTGGTLRSYEADGASGYVEFTFNDVSLTYSIGHAEYQNFNAWHDANKNAELFVGTYADTSGVSSASMVQTNADMRAWPILTTENADWNEAFSLTDYLDSEYPKRVVFGTHKMPGRWSGDNGMFVDASLAKSNTTEMLKYSGIAWQMQGEELGDVNYTQSEGPSGLDTISFEARLAESIGFDDFSVWYGDGSSSTNSYTILVPAIMSSKTSAQATPTAYDFAPGATMSVVGYYQPKVGCYEARIERNSTDGIQISIYKWHLRNYRIVSDLLATHWFSAAIFWQNNNTSPDMYAILLSIGEEGGKTSVIAGLSRTARAPSSTYSGDSYNLVYCLDDGKTYGAALTKGSYGVLSANCSGQFIYPRQLDAPVSWSVVTNTTSGRNFNTKAVTMPATLTTAQNNACRQRLLDAWAYAPGRAQCFTNTNYSGTPKPLGIRPPLGLSQDVELYLKSRDDPKAGWGKVTNGIDRVTVSGYSFVDKKFVVRTNENCHVMLKTGESPVDVTIHAIKQTRWNGEDIANIGNLPNDFVYTQARIVEERAEASTNRYAVLQPARAMSGKALSVRSPILKGLGMVSFSYKDVKPGCEVWLQAATNDVVNGLNGTFGYNFTTNSVDLGAQEPFQSWITLRKFTYDDLKDATMQLYSCGWHTHADSPLVGVFRVVVAPRVVAEAVGHARSDPDWGSITVTDMVVHDEPAIDTRSWLGWNLRTLGDDTDSERRMFLADSMVMTSGEEIGTGLSAGLNNSTTKDIAGDVSEFDKINPTIQSPTFGKYMTPDGTEEQATIGLVRFRARLYETNTASTAKGVISLYGVMDGGGDDWGVALTNIEVSSFVYRPFEYRASSLKRFAAIRLVVDGVTNVPPADVQRVLIDEVSVSEINKASVGFEYARPFRTGLNVDKEITDILSKDQQPLTEESWGVQTKLKFDKFDQEIDTNRGFRVYFRYFVGDSPWGYDKWESASAASPWAELTQVGDYGDYVFRSSAANKAAIVPSVQTANTVVQYMLSAEYYLKGSGEPQLQLIQLGKVEGDGWTNPTWYEPTDYNKDSLHGDNYEYFSPYTILDAVSPGRVWINEVNYCDGPKAQTGGVKCETNQFIEVAVPWGIDLKGWKIKLTDMNHRSLLLAELGKNGVPASKKSTDGKKSGDYDFLVLQSPKTRDAGGIKDSETGLPAADGTWSADSLSSTFKEGSLQYDEPYQIELFRPSGILEHQFVVAGTNEWRTPPEYFWAFGYQYDGTNLVNELNEADPSVRRFYAGEDTARKPGDGAVWSSLGVSGAAHGEDPDDGGVWTSEMKFTPGRINEGQEELTGWYLKPHGASIWVYAQSLGGHVRQRIGDDDAQDTFVIVNFGDSTNITYTIDPWYAIGALTVNGVTNTAATGVTATYQLNLNNITETTTVVASESVDPQLIEAGLDPVDRYTPAIMNWLLARYAAGTLANRNGPISLGKVKDLRAEAPEVPMTLKMMYWFDLDPTEPGWWWRFGFTGIKGEPIYRKRKWNNSFTEHLTNRQVTVKMYLSNDVSQVVYAPCRLQGLGNEQSDIYAGNWTSVTFKVKVMLNNGLEHNAGFLPFRWFTFMPGSFNADFQSKIEILDPFSQSSAGYSYGWYGNPCDSLWYCFSIDDSLETGATIELLKADSSYDGPPFEDDN